MGHPRAETSAPRRARRDRRRRDAARGHECAASRTHRDGLRPATWSTTSVGAGIEPRPTFSVGSRRAHRTAIRRLVRRGRRVPRARRTSGTRSPREPSRRSTSSSTRSRSSPGCGCSTSGCGPGRHSLALARPGLRGASASTTAPTSWRSPGSGRATEGSARRSRSSTCATSRTQASSTPRSACARAASACSAGATRTDGVRPHRRDRCARAVRLAVSAFSAAFAVRHLEAGEDVRPGDRRAARAGDRARPRRHRERPFDLWTTCFTARELELLAVGSRARVDAVHGVTPARTAAQPPTLDHPELLLARARRPSDPAVIARSSTFDPTRQLTCTL